MFLLYYVDQECYTGALKRTKDDNNERTLSKQVFFFTFDYNLMSGYLEDRAVFVFIFG